MQVFIVDEHKYQELWPINEMLVKRCGVRKMNPQPKFMVTGLTSEDEFVMKLRIEQSDDFSYTYQNCQWLPISSDNKNAKLSRMSQVESEREAGATWNRTIVQFDKLRITREVKEIQQNVIHLEPNHKYIPVLSVINVTTGVFVDFKFEQLQFIAVKHYKSSHIRLAKRAFRNFNILEFTSSASRNAHENRIKVRNGISSRPFQESQQMQLLQPSYLYGYGMTGETGISYNPYQFDYRLIHPQLQYSVQQIPYAFPMASTPIQPSYSSTSTHQNSIQDQYVPEYGWNSVLLPGCRREQDESGSSLLGYQHDIWAPQERELESLYFRTEQNYHPMNMN